MMAYVVFGALILLACFYLFRSFRKKLSGGGCGCSGCSGCSLSGFCTAVKEEKKDDAKSVENRK